MAVDTQRLDLTIQKILDSTQYGSHPRLKKLESPITHAYNIENESLLRGRPRCRDASARQQRRSSALYSFDLPQRTPPMRRVNSQKTRLTPVDTVEREKGSFLHTALRDGSSVILSSDHEPLSGDTNSISSTTKTSTPLSAATRHALVMKKRSMISKQVKQSKAVRKDALLQAPSPSSFSQAETIRHTVAHDTKTAQDLGYLSDTGSFSSGYEPNSGKPFQSIFTEEMSSQRNSSISSLATINNAGQNATAKNKSKDLEVGPDSSNRSRSCNFVFPKCC